MSLELELRKVYRYIKSGSFQTKDYLSYKKFLSQNPDKYKKSYFNLTIDFELAWSRARRGDTVTSREESLERSRLAREMLPVLLELCQKYNIPVTFATIAHTALENCYEHQKPPKFSPFWLREDWYKIDPHTNLEKNKDYYGGDLIKKITEFSLIHEIASHSFSHVDLVDEETPREIAEFEIKESFKILKKIYSGLQTFVFPNNRVAHIDLIKETGFTIYRIKQNQMIRKDKLGLFQFPLGLWLSPLAFNQGDLIKLIDLGIERKQLVNFWCHLYEFKSKEQFREFFEPIFSHLEMSQKKGIIDALTIKDIILKFNE